MEFIEWWWEKPWWLRWTVALIPIAIGLIRLATGWFWPWAFAVGGVLVVVEMVRLMRKRKSSDDFNF
jgi:hypothetical protein